ncbi:DUF3147 family protein [Vibrio breoganii]|uniref:DUF3147 family protein n=1 Tax=Vibrio breoganii TaxID=553239 RepID=UPI000C8196AD|nr:DUF3147 family protein [Vibrio breoganii]PML13063.1 hypothetical protein BCT84_14655 [Vibrio breoganii]PMM48355.1 hypothetical protein BCT52_05045 [Vibrio breoganii]TKG29964.1 DUF3147 family protein [Vibrio breoganii]
MSWIITKYLITAGLIVFISEVAKRSDKLGALVAALPTVTILALIWMHIEGLPREKLANHSFYTFWYVLPTLPMFLLFPILIERFTFWISLLLCVGLSLFCFGAVALLARFVGVQLL